MKIRILLLSLCLFFSFQTQLWAEVYVANENNASVTVYATTATGNAAPLRTIAGPATGFNFPESVTVDTVNNELYVADFFGQAVRVFALNASGNVAPLRTLVNGPNSNISQPRMVAIDTTNNEIYVASINDAIRVFPRTASGDAVPTRTISGAATLLNNPISIALDLVHNEVIVDSYDVGGPSVPGILVFSRTAFGNVAPLRFIAGGNTQMGTFTNYVTLDLTNDEIYAQGDNGQGVVVFPRTASGNVAPTRNLTGAATGITEIGGILIDLTNNHLIISDQTNNSLSVFPRSASGNIAPLFTISGPSTGLSEPFGLAMDLAGGFVGPAAVPTSVPSMTEWGMIIFMVVAGFYSIYLLRKKRELLFK
jgi:hypothetical protein